MRYVLPISFSVYFIFTTRQAMYVSRNTEVHLTLSTRGDLNFKSPPAGSF
jgi:hypothetical protein